MTSQEVIATLKAMANPKNVEGMARFGIRGGKMLGISVTELRRFGRPLKHEHQLALELWRSGIHEARILAAIIDDPAQVTEEQMEEWVADFDSWDVCDTACTGLFDKTYYAVKKAIEWSKRDSEFEKRAGFALVAGLAWHSKTEPDETFEKFLPYIVEGSTDERNFVKKAVNWALREIGKRNKPLNQAAMGTAQKIKNLNYPSSRWIAADALRELQSEKVQTMINAL